ncbi:MAG TPA: hypothetical protein VHL11_02520 [Phototrophicaceae bacterium]|nr:hypothetical protein [Phototrophicaceae bacterium]
MELLPATKRQCPERSPDDDVAAAVAAAAAENKNSGGTAVIVRWRQITIDW